MRDEKILELYRDGVTVATIAESVSCTRQTVYRVLKRNGLTPNRLHVFTDKEINRICSMYFKKHPMPHIKNVMGMTRQQVWYVLDRHFFAWSHKNGVKEEAADLLANIRARIMK